MCYYGGLAVQQCPTLATPWTPWTVTHQVPLSMKFSRQEHWSGLPLPSWGDLPNPGIEPKLSCIAGRCFTDWCPREALLVQSDLNKGITEPKPVEERKGNLGNLHRGTVAWIESGNVTIHLPGSSRLDVHSRQTYRGKREHGVFLD